VSLSFSGFCEGLGVPLHNKYWSWCARSYEKRLAVFTVWEDRIDDGRYTFTTQPRPNDVRKKPGRTELVSVLDEAIRHGWAAYGIQCRAVDMDANPRERKSFESGYLLDMRVQRSDNQYIGQIVGKISPKIVSERGEQAGWVVSSAINDIDQDEVGNSDPEYRTRMSGSYVRDDKVRQHVLKRANGVCEECNQRGFLKRDGQIYLETHHIISLSEQGVDKPHNVIALCANDHRQAHFGKNWAELQGKFLATLNRYRMDN